MKIFTTKSVVTPDKHHKSPTESKKLDGVYRLSKHNAQIRVVIKCAERLEQPF